MNLFKNKNCVSVTCPCGGEFSDGRIFRNHILENPEAHPKILL